jgi:hypothetical protein
MQRQARRPNLTLSLREAQRRGNPESARLSRKRSVDTLAVTTPQTSIVDTRCRSCICPSDWHPSGQANDYDLSRRGARSSRVASVIECQASKGIAITQKLWLQGRQSASNPFLFLSVFICVHPWLIISSEHRPRRRTRPDGRSNPKLALTAQNQPGRQIR